MRSSHLLLGATICVTLGARKIGEVSGVLIRSVLDLPTRVCVICWPRETNGHSHFGRHPVIVMISTKITALSRCIARMIFSTLILL